MHACDWLLVSGVSGRCGHVAPGARPGPRRVRLAVTVIGRRCPAPRGTGEVTTELLARCVHDSLVDSLAVQWLRDIVSGLLRLLVVLFLVILFVSWCGLTTVNASW